MFAVNAATHTETLLHSFTGHDGEQPSGLIYQDGAFYGTTVGGGGTTARDGHGTVFKLVP